MSLPPRTVMELQTLTSKLSPVAISWVSSQRMHVVKQILDLLMTDVPDLVRVAVVGPISNSDHSSLSAVISMAQDVPILCVSWKVFLKVEYSLWCNTGSALA